MSSSQKTLFPVLILLGFHLHFTLAARDQFESWYPEWAYTFSTVLRDNCTKEYNNYLHGSETNATVDSINGGEPGNRLAEPVVNCILLHISPYIVSAMGGAQVLLGLTPTMLAVLGPSTEETSLLFVVGRRPFLALWVAAGSPAVPPMRPFHKHDPLKTLQTHPGRMDLPGFTKTSPGRTVAAFVEYLIIAGAIVNVFLIINQLDDRVVSTFAPQTRYLIILWAFGIVVVHLCAAVALLFHLPRVCQKSDENREARADYLDPHTHWNHVKNRVTTFYKPAAPNCKLTVTEEDFFIGFSWFAAILTIIHTIYGTILFSSMLFISVRDSLGVIGRLLLSVAVCRVVLVYELAVLGEN